MFPKEAEVVVIGGGIIGSCITYYLARAGKRVVLVDRGHKSGEASAANAAFVWTITRKPGIDIRLAMHSLALHRQLEAELDMDFQYKHNGGLLVITEEKQHQFVEAHVKARADDGFPLEMIDAKQALELEPLLSEERVLGAVFSPEDGTTNPIFLVAALALQAKKLGAETVYHTEVEGIDVAGGKVTGVITNRGTIKTDTVVNAAGSWGNFVGEMVGLNVPITPFQLAMLVTEQLPPCMFHPVMGASYMVAEDTGKAGGLGCGLIASQQESGNLLLGASWRDAGYDRSTVQEEIELMARVNVEFLPSLKDIRVIRSYANFFPHTDDDLPILGRVDEVEGFIMACGHNGHGVGMGPGTAKLIQEVICGETPGISLDGLSLSRFY
jgi:glycine/D-amino acid oxidase-like deaminating enzyme